MKSILILISFATLISFSLSAQGLVPTHYGLTTGMRNWSTEKYYDKYYSDSIVKNDVKAYNVAIHFKQFLDVGEIGLFEAGLSYTCDFGMSFYKGKSVMYQYETTHRSPILNLGFLGELYFGASDEATFFVGTGGGMSASGFDVGSVLLGPQFIAGKQFYFGDALISFSLSYLKATNKGYWFGFFDEGEYTKNVREQFQFSVDWNIDG